MTMTIAQQLKIKDFPFIIKDKDGNEIYYESSNNYWCEHKYDTNGREVSFEDSTGAWSIHEYDTNGEEIYYKNSSGFIKDNRPKIVEMTLEDIAKKLGIKVEQLRIKE